MPLTVPALQHYLNRLAPEARTVLTSLNLFYFPIPLYPRHACVPVDFEEVSIGSAADEEDVNNAIMAIRRNRVALKGNMLLLSFHSMLV